MEKFTKIPEPTIQRLPLYYRCLSEFKESDREIISSEDIASKIPGMKASQFRKDLSYFGEFGVQGMGYVVTHLLDRISSILQLNKLHFVVLVGAGNLGSALVNYGGFRHWGFLITRIFDSNPDKIGRRLGDIEIEDARRLPLPLETRMGIIAVPPSAAFDTARALVDSGCKGLLNFSGVKLNLPPPVAVRNVDLTNELSILSYKLASVEPPAASPEGESPNSAARLRAEA
jgi:redox-sensing transcriptional repressor